LIISFPTSPRRLILKCSQQFEFTLIVDNSLHGGSTQRPNQLVFEVRHADEKTETFHPVASKADAQTRPLQGAPEVILLSGITETGKSQSSASRAIDSQRSSNVGGAPYWHDRDVFGFEISTTPLG